MLAYSHDLVRGLCLRIAKVIHCIYLLVLQIGARLLQKNYLQAYCDLLASILCLSYRKITCKHIVTIFTLS